MQLQKLGFFCVMVLLYVESGQNSYELSMEGKQALGRGAEHYLVI